MSVEITTPYPTLEEVAESVGVSKKRAIELAALVSEITGREISAYGRVARRAAKKAVAKNTPKKVS